MREKQTPLDIDYRPVLPHRRDWRIGCIGAGFIMSECHLPAYVRAGFTPYAIASKHVENARKVARRFGIRKVYGDHRALLEDRDIEVIDIAVPPDVQGEIVSDAAQHGTHIRGVLAQKPLGVCYKDAEKTVSLCAHARIRLSVNQNMRYDQSIRACKWLLDGGYLGDPVLATIEMRAVPHWMSWQKRQGWVTLRIMSIHHLDTFRFLFGDPQFVYASIRPDPRTSFLHEDGICLYVLEYENGLRAASCDDVWAGPFQNREKSDSYIRWRVEGLEGIAQGTIGWPAFPERRPSTIDFCTSFNQGWVRPRWNEVWFPDAFQGPMAQLLCALEQDREPEISGRDNLGTMALVDACYRSAKEKRAVAPQEIH